MNHRLTPVQKRVLAFIFKSEQPVVFEVGNKRTEFVNGFIIRCQTLVQYFLRQHGYIHAPNELMNRWELTPKGIVAIGGCDVSPTMTHVVGTAGICAFCKRKVARSLEGN
jgi:hypothetical protein